MRRRLIVIGVALAILGAALWYFPVQPVTSGPNTDRGSVYIVGLDAPLDILGGSVPFTLHWQSTFTISVSLHSCGSQPKCTNLGPNSAIGNETGTSGTFHWTGVANTYYALVATSGPLTVTLQYPEPPLGGTVGLSLVIFGGFLAALGAYLPTPVAPVRRSKEPAGDEEILGPDPL